jgi:sulfonate transport system substrate-binding protein
MLRSTFLRAAVAAFLIGLASTSASVAASPATPVTVRLGFLRGPEPLSISRLRGTLEKRLAARNVKVAWVGPFIAYAPAAEALNANAIDITIGSSSAAISSLVGTAPISLFAYQWDAGDSSGIVVRNGSDIKTVADLAGRSVAVNRGGTGKLIKGCDRRLGDGDRHGDPCAGDLQCESCSPAPPRSSAPSRTAMSPRRCGHAGHAAGHQ